MTLKMGLILGAFIGLSISSVFAADESDIDRQKKLDFEGQVVESMEPAQKEFGLITDDQKKRERRQLYKRMTSYDRELRETIHEFQFE